MAADVRGQASSVGPPRVATSDSFVHCVAVVADVADFPGDRGGQCRSPITPLKISFNFVRVDLRFPLHIPLPCPI